MKISRRVRLAQKRRWHPRLCDIVARTVRRHAPALLASIMRHNALYRRLTEREN